MRIDARQRARANAFSARRTVRSRRSSSHAGRPMSRRRER
ncbi:hypothetical protein C7S17_1460 [Burkholderia thailandensis]|nr:hypothetical protein [Burkholderia thailandensis]